MGATCVPYLSDRDKPHPPQGHAGNGDRGDEVREHGVAVTPDGSKVYVANENSNTVSVIATATNTVTATIPVGDGPQRGNPRTGRLDHIRGVVPRERFGHLAAAGIPYADKEHLGAHGHAQDLSAAIPRK